MSTKKRILLIDEEVLLIEPIIDRINYEFEDTEPVHCTNGHDGLVAINNSNFDIIVLDMMVPIGEVNFHFEPSEEMLYGIQILKKIRETNKHTPIICYTVLTDEQISSEIMEHNASYLSKLEYNSYDNLFSKFSHYLTNKAT